MIQLSFLEDVPVRQTRRVTEPIVRSALLSDCCRWWLKRAWSAGPMICWIMCNPSEADDGLAATLPEGTKIDFASKGLGKIPG